MLACVAQSRHLMLSAEFAAALEPRVEESRTRLDYLKRLQGDVLKPLRLVVGVYLLELVIENPCETAEVLRLTRKLYEPLVAALAVVAHKDRSCGVFQYFRTRFEAGMCQSLLGIVDDEFLTEALMKCFVRPEMMNL